MSALTLFDLEPETLPWEPVFNPPLDFDPLKDSERWNAYRALLVCRDCGRPVKRMPWKMGCGGAGDGGAFDLCDDCAALDGAKVSSHATVVEDLPPHFGWPGEPREAAHCLDCGWWLDRAVRSDDDPRVLVPLNPEQVIDLCGEHERPRYRSRWGVAFDVSEFKGRMAARERRRVAYRERMAA